MTEETIKEWSERLDAKRRKEQDGYICYTSYKKHLTRQKFANKEQVNVHDLGAIFTKMQLQYIFMDMYKHTELSKRYTFNAVVKSFIKSFKIKGYNNRKEK